MDLIKVNEVTFSPRPKITTRLPIKYIIHSAVHNYW